jgi:hypothetical protein
LTTQTQVLKKVVSELNAAGIQYMIVGSFAASAHGMTRFSHDLDLVVLLSRDSLAGLAERLGEDFYLDIDAAGEAIDRSDMFNVIDSESSVKVDFWILKNDEFSATQFARRRPANVWGMPAYVESPEDTILSKLLWNRGTPSERQLDDVRGILIVRRATLDYDYLRGWAARLGLSEVLGKVMQEE